MKALLFSLCALALPAFGQSSARYFEHKSKGTEIHITLTVDGESVNGLQFSGSDEPETHGAYGPISGNVRKDGLLHVTYNYEIEGNRQSEEQLLKLDGNKLYLGDGELEERGPGQMVLKDPKSVTFEKAFKEIEVKDAEAQSDEGKAVIQVLQAPVDKLIGAPVVLSGMVRTSGNWARYYGSVSLEEGKKAKDEKTARALEVATLRAYFKKDEKGGWKLVRYLFENTIDLEPPTEGQDFETDTPWVLEEDSL